MTVCRLLGIVLVASAALFAVGSQIERSAETIAEAKASPRELRRDATRATKTATRPSESRAEHRTHENANGEGKATKHADTAHDGETATSTGHAEGGARSQTGERAASTATSELAMPRGSSSAETPEQHRAEVHREAKLFGVNPEAVGLVIAAVLCSLLLAASVWVRPVAAVLAAIVAFGVVFAGFDVREVFHQIDESRASLIAIAGVLAGLHLLVAALAGVELLGGRRAADAAPA
jgi:hypothetical protein